MTYIEAYSILAEKLTTIYESREASIISRYVIEDVFDTAFWSENTLTATELEKYEEVTQRLCQHEPWQYVGGYADFFGLKFRVNPSVLIPRPETEELVFIALDYIKHNEVLSVIDIGTGSGIIPISLSKKSIKPLDLFAVDISPQAITTASENASMHGADIAFFQNNFLDKSEWPFLPKVDMILSNPPYIAKIEKCDMSPNVLQFEPHLALFVGDDTMEFYDAIGEFVKIYQDKGCFILTEINEKHAQQVVETYNKHSLRHISVIQDMQGKDRIVSACK